VSYNVTNLDQELREVGIPIHGVSWDEGTNTLRVDYKEEVTDAQRALALVKATNHNPSRKVLTLQDAMAILLVRDVPGLVIPSRVAEAEAVVQAHVTALNL
jgi:hypothetical protein